MLCSKLNNVKACTRIIADHLLKNEKYKQNKKKTTKNRSKTYMVAKCTAVIIISISTQPCASILCICVMYILYIVCTYSVALCGWKFICVHVSVQSNCSCLQGWRGKYPPLVSQCLHLRTQLKFQIPVYLPRSSLQRLHLSVETIIGGRPGLLLQSLSIVLGALGVKRAEEEI